MLGMTQCDGSNPRYKLRRDANVDLNSDPVFLVSLISIVIISMLITSSQPLLKASSPI